MPVFVGCDLGTTGTKAAVVDDGGRLVGEAYEEVALCSPRPGQVEQDLLDIEASAHRTIAAALARSERAADVAGVAFSSQMSGIGTIDGTFEPATRFDSWLDTRCEPYIARMSQAAERVTALSGCPPTYSHGPKILWWRHERPEDYARVARFVVPLAFVAGRLAGLTAGEAYIDRTCLHFSNLSDTAASRWSDELLDLFGVDADRLPRIADPLEVVGTVTATAAEATGLPEGTPVAAGAGDQTAAALGAGVVEPGQAFDSAGTASVFAMCVDRFAPDLERRTLMATHGVLPGTFIALAFVNGGGLALRWYRDQLIDGPDRASTYRHLDRLAEEVGPGADGLLWFPHLQGRVLPPQPAARGAWVGLTSGHGHGHLFRAVLEGIAYEYATWAQQVRRTGAAVDAARVLGGGARSALWNQIKADVVGIDWVPTERQECGVLGDALIAAAATGHVDDLAATAKAWQRTSEAVRPDPARHERYRRLLAAYRLLGDALGPVFTALRQSMDDQMEGDRHARDVL